MSAARPIIGVTSYLDRAVMGAFDVDAVFLPHSYIAPIEAAGASVVVLPPQDAHPAVVSRILDGIDGLCVSGGYDVNPAAYGQAPHAETDAPHDDRDAWEFALLRGALDRNMPTLGVCRGAQVLNVLRGGTLHQHVPDVVGSSRHQGVNGEFSAVPITVAAGTLLSTMHSAKRTVPVYHHQAIDALGDGLRASAWSDDDIIEAVEDPNLAFCVALQWHPEHDPGSSSVYRAFAAAARAFGT